MRPVKPYFPDIVPGAYLSEPYSPLRSLADQLQELEITIATVERNLLEIKGRTQGFTDSWQKIQTVDVSLLTTLAMNPLAFGTHPEGFVKTDAGQIVIVFWTQGIATPTVYAMKTKSPYTQWESLSGEAWVATTIYTYAGANAKFPKVVWMPSNGSLFFTHNDSTVPGRFFFDEWVYDSATQAWSGPVSYGGISNTLAANIVFTNDFFSPTLSGDPDNDGIEVGRTITINNQQRLITENLGAGVWRVESVWGINIPAGTAILHDYNESSAVYGVSSGAQPATSETRLVFANQPGTPTIHAGNLFNDQQQRDWKRRAFWEGVYYRDTATNMLISGNNNGQTACLDMGGNRVLALMQYAGSSGGLGMLWALSTDGGLTWPAGNPFGGRRYLGLATESGGPVFRSTASVNTSDSIFGGIGGGVDPRQSRFHALYNPFTDKVGLIFPRSSVGGMTVGSVGYTEFDPGANGGRGDWPYQDATPILMLSPSHPFRSALQFDSAGRLYAFLGWLGRYNVAGITTEGIRVMWCNADADRLNRANWHIAIQTFQFPPMEVFTNSAAVSQVSSGVTGGGWFAGPICLKNEVEQVPIFFDWYNNGGGADYTTLCVKWLPLEQLRELSIPLV